MREDDTTWDIFKDAHKFARKEEILEKRKKAVVEEELSAIRSDRVNMEDQNNQQILKEKIDRLHEKLDMKDKILDKKALRERELLEDATKQQEKLFQKDAEIKRF